jgi:hypothetical protein
MGARRPLRITLTGRDARATLAPGAPLTVVSVFERSFYVAREPARRLLACIGGPTLELGPLNARADVAANIDWRKRGLTVGDNIKVRLAGRTIWKPPPPRPRDRHAVARGLEALADAVERRKIADGFGPLIAPLARGESLHGVSPLIATALGSIEQIRRWLPDEDDDDFPLDDPLPLIGLGPGLTPSGDDLVGGIFVAMTRMRWFGRASQFLLWALRYAKNRTNTISYAHLLAAAHDGEGAAGLHVALEAILSGNAPDLDAVAQVGHSSGWDMLAGVTLAAHAWLELQQKLYPSSPVPHFLRLSRPDDPWGGYGDILVHGMTSHRARQHGLPLLERTGPYIPPITFPGVGDLVVTQEARERLERSGLTGLNFQPVIKVLIVRSDWHKWDRDEPEPKRYPSGGEPENYVLGKAHDHEIADEMGPLWEVVIEASAEIVRGDKIRLVASSWNSDDFFRDNGTRHIYVTDRARDWLEANFAEHVKFKVVETV